MIKGEFLKKFSELQLFVSFEDGRILFNDGDFHTSELSENGWKGELGELILEFKVEKDELFYVTLKNSGKLRCDSLKWQLTYKDESQDLGEYFISHGGMNIFSSGMEKLGETKKTKEDSLFCGFFKAADKPCMLFATRIPQSNICMYQAELIGKHEVCFSAQTNFTTGQKGLKTLLSEKTYLISGLTPQKAVSAYAEFLPRISNEQYAKKLVGWNSWDYYFRTVSAKDVEENLEAIKNNKELSEKMKCFIVDDGWQHGEGEWYANYRFPEGTKALADKIKEYGLVPGVWTNGCQIRGLSPIEARHSEMLLKKPDGSLMEEDGMMVLDPTNPVTEEYIFNLYRRLYNDGFRVFKVDFVATLLRCDCFFRAELGPYDVIRYLFKTIRRAVGSDSHILGCSYPVECGAGYVDSIRLGIDIHNQWSHAVWVLESIQMMYWANERVARTDPDFLLVRGVDTSKEKEMNVRNPFKDLEPNLKYHRLRWRRGGDFDKYEAETWANIVRFSAGNVISSDRLSMLNEKGIELLVSHLDSENTTAVPVDLGDDYFASAWLVQEKNKSKLLLIRHEGDDETKVFDFARYSIKAPSKIDADKPVQYENGVASAKLHRHESVILEWENA